MLEARMLELEHLLRDTCIDPDSRAATRSSRRYPHTTLEGVCFDLHTLVLPHLPLPDQEPSYMRTLSSHLLCVKSHNKQQHPQRAGGIDVDKIRRELQFRVEESERSNITVVGSTPSRAAMPPPPSFSPSPPPPRGHNHSTLSTNSQQQQQSKRRIVAVTPPSSARRGRVMSPGAQQQMPRQHLTSPSPSPANGSGVLLGGGSPSVGSSTSFSDGITLDELERRLRDRLAALE
eukprot:PhM_4_TR17152/c0_g1_i1/m.86312